MLALNRTDRTGLAWNIAIALAAVLLVNGLIFLNNPQEMASQHETPFSPPGFVVGIVWTGLFVCMAVARWYLLQRSGQTPSAGAPVVWLAVLCLAYPVYTAGLRNETIGLIGNIVTLLFTVGVLVFCSPRSRAATLWTAPIAVWLTYASFLTTVALRSR